MVNLIGKVGNLGRYVPQKPPIYIGALNNTIKSKSINDQSANNLSIQIKGLQTKLDSVLSSDACAKPNILTFIPKGATPEQKFAALTKMFEESKFFTRLAFLEAKYGKNFAYGELANRICKNASNSILEGHSFKSVLQKIADSYTNENKITGIAERIGSSGVYRGAKEILLDSNGGKAGLCVTGYGYSGENALGMNAYNAYGEYITRLSKAPAKRISPYKDFRLTSVKAESYLLQHPYPNEVEVNMNIINTKYKKFQSLVEKYKENGRLDEKQRKEADDIISEIYYLMANTCPFKRGSNAIADILMRSQYRALGINKSHLKKGKSLDFEAFLMSLNKYKSKWNSFFE